ncbi:MAG: hypothetical protein V1716_01080 [Candidatus Uhrbacteria bacterium]
MSVNKIIEILQESELDRETKLKIIDFLSVTDDQQKVDDLFDLLTAWQTVDLAEKKDFQNKLMAIMKVFEKKADKIENSALLSGRKIVDNMETVEKIETLKKQISSY